jgi:hypothetical protein
MEVYSGLLLKEQSPCKLKITILGVTAQITSVGPVPTAANPWVCGISSAQAADTQEDLWQKPEARTGGRPC